MTLIAENQPESANPTADAEQMDVGKSGSSLEEAANERKQRLKRMREQMQQGGRPFHDFLGYVHCLSNIHLPVGPFLSTFEVRILRILACLLFLKRLSRLGFRRLSSPLTGLSVVPSSEGQFET